MIDRPQYLRALRRWKDKQMIKVITGIRRCGKSTLMELFQAELRLDGVPDSQIIAVNLEDFANIELRAGDYGGAERRLSRLLDRVSEAAAPSLRGSVAPSNMPSGWRTTAPAWPMVEVKAGRISMSWPASRMA